MTFALVDCNNFYASCERVFNPQLAGKPVVVLSNNDGCVVARSAESKLLGIPMGAPYFKIEQEFRKLGGIALSSNYALYADMSNRVMSILASYSPQQEVYSIDECFLGMTGFEGLTSIGRDIRRKVLGWTGLPVCVGFATSKTLAKLANHVAKKRSEWQGVCDLTGLSLSEQDALVGSLAVGEVWGVGRKIEARLGLMGISTVRQLRVASPSRIREAFGVVLERTVMELNGVSCIALEEVAPAKQQIMVSRSFGAPVYDLAELQNAVGEFIGNAAVKLRKQSSCAGLVMVFIRTSPFRVGDAQYGGSLVVPLPSPSNDTLLLSAAALAGLAVIYKPGFAYAKAGVMLSELVNQDYVPQDLFAEPQVRDGELMVALDKINAKFGKGKLVTGVAMSRDAVWKMRQNRRSPRYTTRFDDLIRIRA